MKKQHKSFLLFLAVSGLMIGCGGHKGTESPKGDEKKAGNATGANGGGEKMASLATFLPGKRISFTVHDPEAPPKFQKQTVLIQFEMNGKALAIADEKKSRFKVEDLKMIATDLSGKGDASITFSSANPKVGDKITLLDPGEPQDEEVTIAAIEKAGKMEPISEFGFGQPEPSGPEPEVVGGSGALNTTPDGESAIGFGPKGEVAKSKHPAFLVHAWRVDPTSEGPKHGAIFAKDGTLSLIKTNGKQVKGEWNVADKILTLTYPNAETSKEQSLKFQFLFGRGELDYSDGGVEPYESLQLTPVGDGPKVEYIRSAP